MNNVSTRQLIIFYGIYSFSIKFLMLPSFLADVAGPDCWIAAAFGTVAELVILFLALTVLTLNQNKSLYEKPSTTPVTILMLGVFLLQLFILINQTFHLLNDNIFESVPNYLFMIPMLLLGIFFCFMPTRAVFRSGEIFFVFIIIGIILSVFPAITRINPSEVFPMFRSGVMPSINAFYQNLIYFESSFMLLIFCGEIKIEKHFRKKFMTTATILGVFFVFFVFMFYSLFGPLAPMKSVAITNFTLYSTSLTTSGQLDWVLVTIWLLLLLLRFGITFFCAFVCLRHITRAKKRAGIISISLAVFVFLISAFVFTTTRDLNNFINSIPWLIAVLFAAVPVALLCLSFIYKRRNRNV